MTQPITTRSALSLVVALAVAPLLMGSSDLREDQFECEQAASHLKSCCGSSFDARAVDCEYTAGCSNDDSYPALTVGVSKCIEAKSCDALLADDLCTAIGNLGVGERGSCE